MNILFVGGTFDESYGKKSSLVETFFTEINCRIDAELTLYNGGNYYSLEKILNSVTDYDIVFWWANIPNNNLPKIRNVKEINNKTMLISSKRNDGKYSFGELINSALMLKSNLVVEFSKTEIDKFKMRVFDPLGNVWFEGYEVKDCVKNLLDRILFLKSITRQNTVKVEDDTNLGLAWYFDQFVQENYKSDKKVELKNENEFFELVKDYAEIFHEKMKLSNEVKRFLGNASFRCCKGFPSFRCGKYIFVSKRNVDKRYIDKKHFVATYLKDNEVYYCGENKPSVDTPIQLRLYEKLKNINYIIHSHCYIKDAAFTSISLPCGAIEEVDEIISTILDTYHSLDCDFYKINLIGHGSTIMSNDVGKLKNVEFVSRKLPEKIFNN